MNQFTGGVVFLIGVGALFGGIFRGDPWLIVAGLVLYGVGHYHAEPQYYTNPDNGEIDE